MTIHLYSNDDVFQIFSNEKPLDHVKLDVWNSTLSLVILNLMLTMIEPYVHLFLPNFQWICPYFLS